MAGIREHPKDSLITTSAQMQSASAVYEKILYFHLKKWRVDIELSEKLRALALSGREYLQLTAHQEPIRDQPACFCTQALVFHPELYHLTTALPTSSSAGFQPAFNITFISSDVDTEAQRAVQSR